MLNTAPKGRTFIKRILNPKFIMVYATVIIFLVIYAFGGILYGSKGFLTLRTFLTFFVDNAYIGIMAIGMTVVLISGGIDLSVASVASLTGMFIAYGNAVLGINPFICIAFSLMVGTILGMLMGAMIHYLNVAPFITTLTGMFLARGITALISRDSIAIRSDVFTALATWKIKFDVKPIAYINLNILVFLVVLLAGIYIMHFTRFGRNVYAIGGSEQSAQLMALPVARTKIMVYGFSGFCSALGGVAYAMYVKSGWNLSLMGAELDAISSAVIGGTLLTGGTGYVLGTLFGVLLKSMIPTLITFNGTLSSWWGRITIGVLLLIFIGLQRIVIMLTSGQQTMKSKHKHMQQKE